MHNATRLPTPYFRLEETSVDLSQGEQTPKQMTWGKNHRRKRKTAQ